ncbi:hypothetical protein ABES25_09905 [Bacillus gobiensis]|uniref:hypothetical protein n=1 Tax=Bacillus gobiensis TaxID=1441095 RepID=UPI003D19FF8B
MDNCNVNFNIDCERLNEALQDIRKQMEDVASRLKAIEIKYPFVSVDVDEIPVSIDAEKMLDNIKVSAQTGSNPIEDVMYAAEYIKAWSKDLDDQNEER